MVIERTVRQLKVGDLVVGFGQLVTIEPVEMNQVALTSDWDAVFLAQDDIVLVNQEPLPTFED